MLNGKSREDEYYAKRSDVDRLENIIQNDIISALARIEFTNTNIVETLRGVKDNLNEVNKRNIQQDTILGIIKKTPGLLNYIFGALGLLIMFADHDFSIKDWLSKEARSVVHLNQT
jgi:hypothetical protein